MEQEKPITVSYSNIDYDPKDWSFKLKLYRILKDLDYGI